MRQQARIVTDTEENTQFLSRIKWNNDKDGDKMKVMMWNRNKKGEMEVRGFVYISFQMIPVAIADLSPVGQARDSPNNDPHLPQPAGRISL